MTGSAEKWAGKNNFAMFNHGSHEYLLVQGKTLVLSQFTPHFEYGTV